ncbi:type IV pilus modification PilV family protein [Geomonas oryzisoli]|nr:pilus assembly protein PilV [Geomonas oryzisoli]
MAMLVMTVGLLGLLQSVNVAYQQNLKDQLRKEAVQVAEARMHDWCREPFDRITSAGTATIYESHEKVVGGTRWQYEVSRKLQPVGTATKKLCVGVIWSIRGTKNSHEIFVLRTRRKGE